MLVLVRVRGNCHHRCLLIVERGDVEAARTGLVIPRSGGTGQALAALLAATARA